MVWSIFPFHFTDPMSSFEFSLEPKLTFKKLYEFSVFGTHFVLEAQLHTAVYSYGNLQLLIAKE